MNPQMLGRGSPERDSNHRSASLKLSHFSDNQRKLRRTMKSHVSLVLKSTSLLAAVASAVVVPGTHPGMPFGTGLPVIERDFAILGGGASGTYAGVTLGDLNRTVVVIERNAELGGHTNTYVDPSTQAVVNYGVQLWHNDSVTRDFFQRLDSPLAGPSPSNVSTLHVDFDKPEVQNDYKVAPIGPDYLNEAAKYPYLDDGFLLPDQIPEDLLLSWPEYMRKHSITSSAHAIFQAPGPAGDPLKRLALYVFNFVNSVVIGELSGEIVANADGDNHHVYRNAYNAIGVNNVLLNSTISHARRDARGVELVLSTPDGKRLVRAKQLIVAAPPRADNLRSLSLDSREHTTLGQVRGYPFYAGVVKNAGLPVDFNYQNVGADTPFQTREPPCLVFINPAPALPGAFYYTYSSLVPLSQKMVEHATALSIRKLQIAMKGNGSDCDAVPEFVAFADHSPFHFEQSVKDIRDRFYERMYALQGYRNTWYIGALFVLSSSQLWNNTLAMLPAILAAADGM